MRGAAVVFRRGFAYIDAASRRGEATVRRRRAAHPARIGHCCDPGADRGAGRALFCRLDQAAAAVRGRSHARRRPAGARRGRDDGAAVADAVAAAAQCRDRRAGRQPHHHRAAARCRVQPRLADARRVARQRADGKRRRRRYRSRCARPARLADAGERLQSRLARRRQAEPHGKSDAARCREPRQPRPRRHRFHRRRARLRRRSRRGRFRPRRRPLSVPPVVGTGGGRPRHAAALQSRARRSAVVRGYRGRAQFRSRRAALRGRRHARPAGGVEGQRVNPRTQARTARSKARGASRRGSSSSRRRRSSSSSTCSMAPRTRA